MNLQPIPVRQLRVGMYVAKLDRPWSETPFQFEGFEVLSESEIDLLAEHCRLVYVDPSYVSASVTARHASRRRSSDVGTTSDSNVVMTAQRDQLAARLQSGPALEHPRQTKLEAELDVARDAFAHARTNTKTLLARLKNGEGLSAADVHVIVQPMVESVLRNPDAMVWLASLSKLRPSPVNRQICTAVWIAVFGRYMGLSPELLTDLASGGLLLDVGMTRMARTLRETPEVYTKHQRLAVQGHVRVGMDLIDVIQDLSEPVRLMVAQHHERVNGSGYPFGLKGDDISIFGAVAAVTDCYDAMLSEAPHRAARSAAEAISELNRLSAEELTDTAVEQFVQALGLFPCGSVVELNTGEIAIVVEQDPARRLRPQLLVVRDRTRQPLVPPRPLNLAHFETDRSHTGALWIDRAHPPAAFDIDLQAYLD
ncbi:MAG: DUF3391 domain-containing protein [Pseudomonadota bacterium]